MNRMSLLTPALVGLVRRGYDFTALRNDVFGGLTAAVIALPFALVFGVASGAGPIAGLYGAIATDFFAAVDDPVAASSGQADTGAPGRSGHCDSIGGNGAARPAINRGSTFRPAFTDQTNAVGRILYANAATRIHPGVTRLHRQPVDIAGRGFDNKIPARPGQGTCGPGDRESDSRAIRCDPWSQRDHADSG